MLDCLVMSLSIRSINYITIWLITCANLHNLGTVGLPGPKSHPMWWVQVSDIHLSSHVPSRERDLLLYFTSALQCVKPLAVLITGDLTDAKNKWRTVTRQDEGEWKSYRRVVEALVAASGLPEASFIDVRGNHDTFEVPVRGGYSDFFSKYSVSARQNRTSAVYRVNVTAAFNDPQVDPLLSFVVVDTSPRTGLRGPANFFGHPEDADLEDLADLAELQRGGGKKTRKTFVVGVGHYPLSFVAPSHSGAVIGRYVPWDAYVAGHLHYKFGKRMYREHKKQGGGSFWELAAGDWKDNRIIRLMALDDGQLSFAEVKLVPDTVTATEAETGNGTGNRTSFTALVLVTHPPDARFSQGSGTPKPPLIETETGTGTESGTETGMEAGAEPANMQHFRVLIFSDPEPSSASLTIFRLSGKTHEPIASLQLDAAAAPLYTATWHPNSSLLSLSSSSSSSSSSSCSPLWLQTSLSLPASPQPLQGALQPFCPVWCGCHLLAVPQSPLEWSLMHLPWAHLWPVSLAAMLGTLWAMLLLPKWTALSLGGAHRAPAGRRPFGGVWGTWCRAAAPPESAFSHPWGAIVFCLKGVLSFAFVLLWALLALPSGWVWVASRSANHAVWYVQVAFLGWLTCGGVWFWGQPLGEGLPPGAMSLAGWTAVATPGGKVLRGLGVPDVVTTVVLFLCLCVGPAFLWIPLFLETRRWRRSGDRGRVPGVATQVVDGGDEVRPGRLRRRRLCEEEREDREAVGGEGREEEGDEGVGQCSWGRKGGRVSRMLLPAFVWVWGAATAYFVFWQLSTLSAAYGGLVLLASPGYTWPWIVLIAVLLVT